MGLAGVFSLGTELRVAVFIDWMNVYKTAREAFGLQKEPSQRGQIDPYRAGRVLAKASGRGANVELARVEIHRGQPLPNQDRLGRVATSLQEHRWRLADPEVVKAQLRPLRLNPATKRLEEKGVDVALAACAIEWAIVKDIDRVVIFSHDTDLSPAVEVIARIKGPHAVETASWRGNEYRKRIPPIEGVRNHLLSEKVFLALEDVTHYGRTARARIAGRSKPQTP